MYALLAAAAPQLMQRLRCSVACMTSIKHDMRAGSHCTVGAGAWAEADHQRRAHQHVVGVPDQQGRPQLPQSPHQPRG